MKQTLLVAIFGLIGGLTLPCCSGSSALGELHLLERGLEYSIPITVDQQVEKQWARPLHPESNSTFTTINGIPYYRLGPGDGLELTLNLGDGPTTYDLVIGPEGDVRLPSHLLTDRVRIAGLAVPQAEQRIAAALAGILRRPLLALRVTSYRSAYVTLVGEIAARATLTSMGEGRYALTGRTTLLDFILTYSSFTDETDYTAVIVTDSMGRTGMFDLSATIYAADQSQNPVLDRGDVVTVPSLAVTRRHIFVLGEVTTPSLVRPRPGMTVIDAVSEAGGLNQQARQRWITLVRGRGQEAQLYKIPYSNILKKGDLESNIPLQPGDIIYVGRSEYNSVITFFRDIWGVLQTAVIVSILADRF